ncbi:YceI family protein [Chitinophaga solisilvae]|uniref:YceI family protein n=1 Tax=Chitinophaga solisilvae TaxID=1233460 RepID=A0A3S1B0U0_9BACT|nr:YceI family protein [Chitinophaga solisilvae]NSL88936.1 YceI family protein [Chitinophaga solisilvae]
MKNLLLLLGCMLLCLQAESQDIFSCRNANLSFFSSAPLEDIEAKTDKGVSAINIKTKAIYFKVPVASFKFRKKLMEEHFNQNYLESDKYPYAEFKGKITEETDLTKDGTYPVTVTGTLSIHGVEKNYQEKGTITVQGNNIRAVATFNVHVADHRIQIPTIVVKNIAEVVAVTVNAGYTPVSK